MLRLGVVDRMSQTSSVLQHYLQRRCEAGLQPRKVRLLSVDEVSDVHREPGIISGYVPHGSPWLCVRGLFLATNETINFWTHFLPALYFVWKLAALRHSLELADPFTWPYICYMVTTCVYPLVSCGAHAFSAMSVKAAHVGFFVDYAAISLFGFGVGVLYRSYCFPEAWQRSLYADCFPAVCAANSVVCTLLACRSRFLRRSRWRKRARMLAFVVPYAWDNVPLVYRMLTCGAAGGPLCHDSNPFHLRQMGASMAGSFFYGTHLPERMAPGTFDIIGHSHNFLHIFGIWATNEQMNGALLDMQALRAAAPRPNAANLHFWATWGCGMVVVANAVIVAVSIVAMCRKVDRERQKQ